MGLNSVRQSPFFFPKMIQVVHEWNRKPPRELEKRLAEVGGHNWFGRSNFRMVWSEARMEWQGGRWNDFAEDGRCIRSVVEVRRVPRYLPFVGWIVEAWQPPEYYGSPENWCRRYREQIEGISVDTLGPYPQQGDYEEVFRFPGSLTSRICDAVIQTVLIGRHMRLQRRWELAQRRLEEKQRRWEDLADDVLRDAGQAFPGPFVAFGGTGRHSSVEFCQKAGIRSHPF